MQMLFPHRRGTMSPAGVADAFEWPDTDQPWVRGVMVATADGGARAPSGLSAGISSASDHLVFATVRALSDVVLVGATTVRAEGYGPVRVRPALAERRAAAGLADLPRIAIVTASGALDPTSPLFTESVEPPLLLVPEALPAGRRAALEPVAELVVAGEQRVDTTQALTALGDRGLSRVDCEGGPHLIGQLAAEGNLHELCLTVTPLLSGGRYVDRDVPRILAGGVLPDPPQAMRLAHVIESDGTLFLRYVVGQS